MKVTNNKLGLASSVYTVTHMYYTHVHTYLSPSWPKDQMIFQVCIQYTHYMEALISFGHGLNHKYIRSHQCCTNTYAHINAVQIHMLTSMLQIHMLTSMLYKYICSHQCYKYICSHQCYKYICSHQLKLYKYMLTSTNV